MLANFVKNFRMKDWSKNAIFFANTLIVSILACNSATQAPRDRPESVAPAMADSMAMFPRNFEAQKLTGWPRFDGGMDSIFWSKSSWLPLDQVWIGKKPAPADFSGRYKVAWDRDALYVLAEITDDKLEDTHPDGLVKYWDDDCLEIFVDEDASGGGHQFNYNAFAYHIALDGKVADFGTDSLPHFYNDHCRSVRKTVGNKSVWEVAVKVFDDKFDPKKPSNRPIKLVPGKKMGFALSYCDNDGSPERENFIGSIFVPGADKNRGYIDASIFGKLLLK